MQRAIVKQDGVSRIFQGVLVVNTFFELLTLDTEWVYKVAFKPSFGRDIGNDG